MRLVTIDYMNWRGERRWRIVEPTGKMRHEVSQWHPTPQWIMYAYDTEDGKVKGFAMEKIHQWTIAESP